MPGKKYSFEERARMLKEAEEGVQVPVDRTTLVAWKKGGPALQDLAQGRHHPVPTQETA